MAAITKEEIIAIAVAELSQKTLGYTEQFLEIHEVALQDDIPLIEHVRMLNDGTSTVYFKVHDESFFFAVSVDIEKRQARWSYSEVYAQVSFVAESATLNSEQLSSYTKLTPNWSYNTGDELGTFIKRSAKINRIGFQPNLEPDDLESKLVKLLDHLETDTEGINNLIKGATDAYIITTTEIHNFNSHIGGINLEPHILKRLAALNVSIDFDFYAVGNLFKGSDIETYSDDDEKEEG